MRRGRDKECGYCGALFFNSLRLGFVDQSGGNHDSPEHWVGGNRPWYAPRIQDHSKRLQFDAVRLDESIASPMAALHVPTTSSCRWPILTRQSVFGIWESRDEGDRAKLTLHWTLLETHQPQGLWRQMAQAFSALGPTSGSNGQRSLKRIHQRRGI